MEYLKKLESLFAQYKNKIDEDRFNQGLKWYENFKTLSEKEQEKEFDIYYDSARDFLRDKK